MTSVDELALSPQVKTKLISREIYSVEDFLAVAASEQEKEDLRILIGCSSPQLQALVEQGIRLVAEVPYPARGFGAF